MQLKNKVLYKQKCGSFLCPKCRSKVIWVCSLGNVGYAYCTRSLHATQIIPIKNNSVGSKIKSYCTWKGKTKRKNKKIIIVYNE